MRPRLPHLAVISMLAGCGSSAEADKTAPFVGNWTITTGTLAAMCPAPLGMQGNALDNGQQTIGKAADGSLLVSILPGCSVTLDVTGSMATLRTMPPQTCMLTFKGIEVMATFASGTFTVTGQTASFSYTGTAAALGGAITCPVTASGMSMKSAPAEAGVPADAGPGADAGTTAGADGASGDGP